MPKDYSYLEGQEFTYFNNRGLCEAKVLYADYHVGITCVDLNDPDHYLICLQGPSAPFEHEFNKRQYQAMWSSIVKQIQHGHVNARKLAKVYENQTKRAHNKNTSPSSEDCAFGQ